MIQIGRVFETLLAIVLGSLISSAIAAQGVQRTRKPPANSYPRALAAYAAGDLDRDGRISVEEAAAMPVSEAVFKGKDENQDGFWSRDEFIVFYRHQLIVGGQPVGDDLEAEVARLQALKRVRAVEETKKLTAETSASSADAASVERRFEAALSDLERRLVERKATRADYQRVRNLVLLNGRIAEHSSSHAVATQKSLLAALDRIEKRAAAGETTVEEFQILRGTPRPNPIRPIPPGTANPAPAARASPPVTAGPADARRRSKPTQAIPKRDPAPVRPPAPSTAPKTVPPARPPSTPPRPSPPPKEKPDRSRP